MMMINLKDAVRFDCDRSALFEQVLMKVCLNVAGLPLQLSFWAVRLMFQAATGDSIGEILDASLLVEERFGSKE